MDLKTINESLPQPLYSATQVLQYEGQAAKNAGISLYDLMQSAGQACFELIKKQCHQASQILVVCGKGNNGGDGFVIAKLCASFGYKVDVLLLAELDAIAGDARRAYEQLPLDKINLSVLPELAQAPDIIEQFEGDVIVDAIFGIGFKGELALNWLHVVGAINQHCAQVLSVDVPSGLNASTGAVSTDAIMADWTVTFIAYKQGLLTGKSANYLGELLLAPLALQQELVQCCPATVFAQGNDGLPAINHRCPTIHKGSIGLVLTIGGNIGMPGAIRLSSEAALRAGAALVAVSCHVDNHSLVCHGRPELMLAPSESERMIDSSFFQKAKAIVIGPGMGQDKWAKQMFTAAIKSDKQLVVDADGLALVKKAQLKRDNWVLTPHPGEAAYLLDTDINTIEADRFYAVTEIAKRYGGICVLKGAGSLISDGQTTIVNTTGNSGMASGGMGDVLSGIIGALMLQTNSLYDATKLAVSIHGQAAQAVTKGQGLRGLLASDLFEPIRQLVNRY